MMLSPISLSDNSNWRVSGSCSSIHWIACTVISLNCRRDVSYVVHSSMKGAGLTRSTLPAAGWMVAVRVI